MNLTQQAVHYHVNPIAAAEPPLFRYSLHIIILILVQIRATIVDMLTFAGVTPCSQVFYIGGCPRLSSKGFQHALDGHEGVLRLAQ